MFFLNKPSEKEILRLIERQKDAKPAYREVGLSRAGESPAGFVVDHNRVKLGSGRHVFLKAAEAVRAWKMFDFDWIELHRRKTPISEGETVAVLVSHLGFWSANLSKIVYTIEEESRFGFAYGTLAEHSECGEERFLVEFDREDESVSYDIFAFSRPQNFLARVANPYARFLQKRFAAESKQAMKKAVCL